MYKTRKRWCNDFRDSDVRNKCYFTASRGTHVIIMSGKKDGRIIRGTK